MTLKIASRHTDGEMVLLELAGGGEVGVPAGTVRGFVPDEVIDEVAPGAAAGGDVRALVADAARRHGLDPALVLAVVSVESGFRPDAVSPKGAQGLMQLMPKTAASLGVADAFDAAANVEGGARHLGSLVARYGGDLKEGPRRVQRRSGRRGPVSTRSTSSRSACSVASAIVLPTPCPLGSATERAGLAGWP